MLLVEDYRVRISTQDERLRFRLLSTRSSNLKRRDIYMMGRKEKRVRGTDQPWQAFTAGQLQGLSSNPDRPFGVESVTGRTTRRVKKPEKEKHFGMNEKLITLKTKWLNHITWRQLYGCLSSDRKVLQLAW